MEKPKCKICRRVGVKLFLKGERCFSPKCAVVRKPYPPGIKPKKRKSFSEYGRELREKQKLRNWYNLKERKFKKYVKETLGRKAGSGDFSVILMEKLESRLDSVVFRLGFTPSRKKAKQLVGHNHFLVNGKKINIPSYQVKKGDKISINPKSISKGPFQNAAAVLKKQKMPAWIEFNLEKLEAKIVAKPSLEEMAPPAEISSIFEYYSR